MDTDQVRLPYGDETISVTLPDCDVTAVKRPGGAAVDVRAAADRALEAPHGPGITEVVAPDDAVAIVVTDVTRATPDDILLDAFFSRLPGEVTADRVSVVLGLGLHRPMTDAEIQAGFGDHAPLVENHDPKSARQVGEVDGVPVMLNATVDDADIVLATGMVEPHQYAGFSGGAKTVVIGAGGEPVIRYTHGPDMLSRDAVRLGRVDDNPFRDAVDRAGDVAGPDFCINVTKGPAGVLGVAAGQPRDVVGDLSATAREALSVEVAGTYDVVLAGVGAPKDANLYQTTRALTYLVLGDHNPVREGGRVVIPARLSEGAGEGKGERRFHERLRSAESPADLYTEMRAGYEPGAQRAFVVARALREVEAYVTNSTHPEVVEECLMETRDSVAEAVAPGSDVLVVPDALNTLVV
jgi:nickel-dependent lactate racemase